MNKKQNFLTGAAILSLSTIIVKIIGMFYKLPLNAIIGEQGFAYFTAAYDIYSVLLVISTTGLPVAMSRSVVKLDEKKATTKVKRWQAIAEAAAKQSKRGVIPQVQRVMTYKEALAYAKDMEVKLLPYELAEGMAKTKELIGQITKGQDVAIFIGPEGGFATEEVERASAEGFEAVTLGKRILRTETAGMTLLSILMYHLEQ